MKLTDLLEESKLSRRKLLQGLGSVAAVATVSGCSSDDGTDSSALTLGENLVMDTSLKQVYSTGSYNCGARCVHKVHVKNGRILKFTSCGDVKRLEDNSSESVGENGISIQRRACVRGYSYVQRIYQPDRLKYPLVQFGERGDINGFKRVTWEYAVNKAADALNAAINRRATLGYTPIMGIANIGYLSRADVKPTIFPYVGNESTGGADGAKWDILGADALTNNVSDRLNSKFIITWGLDPSRTTYHIGQSHWYNTKAKEAGIPIVCITTNYNDSAAMLATGVPNHQYAVGGTNKTVSIPAWIPCRPATDGALAAAMAYVIYKNGWMDAAYVGTPTTPQNEKSFGFYPNDVVTSTAPGGELVDGSTHRYKSTTSSYHKLSAKNMKSPAQFTDDSATPKTYEKGDSYKGATFTVPAGESFAEYLDSLEVEWGGAGSAGAAIAGDATYKAVLNYVERLTGINADVIEALAHKYAKSGDGTNGCLLDVGGGPQRAWNGTEWVSLMIALATMTGNIDKPGGGAGLGMCSITDMSAIGINAAVVGAERPLLAPSFMLSDADTVGNIFTAMNDSSHLVLTGKDHRTREKLIEDIKISTISAEYPNGLDLSGVPADQKLIEVDVWVMINTNQVTTKENINKVVAAVKTLKEFIVIDQVMTPTATHASIVFPATTHYEKATVEFPINTPALFAKDKAIDKQYDARSDNEIQKAICDRLNVLRGTDFNTAGFVDAETITEAALNFYDVNSVYKKVVNPNAELKHEDLMKNGFVEAIIPPSKPLVGCRDYPHSMPGTLENTTGKINFWSPLWGKIRPKTNHVMPANTKDAAGNDISGQTIHNGFRNATIKYQPHIEGYEKFFANNDPRQAFTGYPSRFYTGSYPLYYMTNKARNRAHTVFDNVGMIKSEFEQNVKINPVDAASRGINNGDMVYVYNDRGCTKIPASVTQEIPPGVISVEHGAWYRAHPTEKIKVMMQTGIDEQFVEKTVSVDVGGAENILTLDLGTTEQYVGHATNAQGGPCEVSLTLPADRRG